jgi:hypothetical protein
MTILSESAFQSLPRSIIRTYIQISQAADHLFLVPTGPVNYRIRKTVVRIDTGYVDESDLVRGSSGFFMQAGAPATA